MKYFCMSRLMRFKTKVNCCQKNYCHGNCYNKVVTKLLLQDCDKNYWRRVLTQNGRDTEIHTCVHAIFVLQKITLLNYPFPRQFFLPPYCIESFFIHHSHFVLHLYFWKQQSTWIPPPHRDPTYEDLIYLTIMISKSWTISTLLRNLGHIRIISKVSGLGGRERPVST